MEKAVFNLENYCFSDIQLHLANLEEETTLSLNFEPQGVFDKQKKTIYFGSYFSSYC